LIDHRALEWRGKACLPGIGIGHAGSIPVPFKNCLPDAPAPFFVFNAVLKDVPAMSIVLKMHGDRLP
jgi:hypothetical protein